MALRASWWEWNAGDGPEPAEPCDDFVPDDEVDPEHPTVKFCEHCGFSQQAHVARLNSRSVTRIKETWDKRQWSPVIDHAFATIEEAEARLDALRFIFMVGSNYTDRHYFKFDDQAKRLNDARDEIQAWLYRGTALAYKDLFAYGLLAEAVDRQRIRKLAYDRFIKNREHMVYSGPPQYTPERWRDLYETAKTERDEEDEGLENLRQSAKVDEPQTITREHYVRGLEATLDDMRRLAQEIERKRRTGVPCEDELNPLWVISKVEIAFKNKVEEREEEVLVEDGF